ncbi:MAG: glycosyltransferase, partial [Lachnoanaerobaculum sp.]|nr:glycosyltransferase [Lachnoanaerobaculum sp.]
MNNCRVSVIIPVFNLENFLRRCIDSVLNQSFSGLEIIIVDDESTDNSGKI